MARWNPTNAEVADLIEAFLDGTCEPWDWDDFLSVEFATPYLTAVQSRCNRSRDDFPPGKQGGWSSEEGAQELRRIVAELRGPLGPV